jgi:hypothetical protein
MKKTLLLAFAGLFLAAPLPAAVYMTNEVDPVSNFCQAVATTKDTYCPRVKINCKSIKKKAVAFFIKQAKLCNNDPSKLSDKDANLAMSTFSTHQNALCCYSLSK